MAKKTEQMADRDAVSSAAKKSSEKLVPDAEAELKYPVKIFAKIRRAWAAGCNKIEWLLKYYPGETIVGGVVIAAVLIAIGLTIAIGRIAEALSGAMK